MQQNGRYRRLDDGFRDRPPQDVIVFDGWCRGLMRGR